MTSPRHFHERLRKKEKEDDVIPLEAFITTAGRLSLPDEYILSTSEARRLAQWILKHLPKGGQHE